MNEMNKEKVNPRKEQETPAATGMSSEFLSEEETEAGAVRISDNVIAAVVRKYTLEVGGVVRFASGSLVGGLAEMIGRKNAESSIVVDLEGETVNIAVTLVLEFGVRIPEVCALVQDVIQTRVEELTGKHVTKVDVVVQDLEEKRPVDESGSEEQ